MASSSSLNSSGQPPQFEPALPAVAICFQRPVPPRAYRGMSNLQRAVSDENFMRLAFSEWKEDMGRVYPFMEEEMRHYELFKSAVSECGFKKSERQ